MLEVQIASLVAILVVIGFSIVLIRSSKSRVLELDSELSSCKEIIAKMHSHISELEKEAIAALTEAKAAEQRLFDRDRDFQRQQAENKNQFELLANKIMDKNAEKFESQSLKSIDHLLTPLASKLKEFELRVETAYSNEARERFALKEELHKMLSANQQISLDAQNLTDALKGDIKVQGNWGEIQLERILEGSGLIEGEEYTREAKGMNLKDEQGNNLRPDVIINLPDEKHIILDSKVSMKSYTDYAATTTDKDQFLKEFCKNTKRHVDGLAGKHYDHIKNLNSPDFVLMFCPLEAAFSALMHNQGDMFTYAWEKRIIIVSPTNLLATLRTISSIWKTERQNKNALEIARKGGAVYDKFVGFIADMEKIGKGLDLAQKDYHGAMSKLSTGRGNLVTSVEKLKKLGAKTTKTIDTQYLDSESVIEPALPSS